MPKKLKKYSLSMFSWECKCAYYPLRQGWLCFHPLNPEPYKQSQFPCNWFNSSWLHWVKQPEKSL